MDAAYRYWSDCKVYLSYGTGMDLHRGSLLYPRYFVLQEDTLPFPSPGLASVCDRREYFPFFRNILSCDTCIVKIKPGYAIPS